VLICGKNNFGRLGTKKKEDFVEETDFDYIKSFQIIGSLADKFIIQISCGENHSLAL